MKKQRYLIAYDIRDAKRLTKIYKLIKQHSIPVQRSVFIAHLQRDQLTALKQQLEELIHPKQDDIRIYKLPATSDIELLGAAKQSIGLTQLQNQNSREEQMFFLF